MPFSVDFAMMLFVNFHILFNPMIEGESYKMANVLIGYTVFQNSEKVNRYGKNFNLNFHCYIGDHFGTFRATVATFFHRVHCQKSMSNKSQNMVSHF